MEAGRLTVTISEIDEVKATQIINLPTRQRTLPGTLLASMWRAFWLSLFAYPVHTNAVDASYRPDTTDTENAPPAQEDKTAEAGKEPFDEELSRFVNMFKLARESGYTLKLVPGTSEENTVNAATIGRLMLYACFEPAQKAWRQATYTPLGVVLGRTDPALFLYFFSYGKTVQKESVEFHLSGLMNSLDVEQKMDNGSTHGFVMNPKENSEAAVAAHTAWHVGMACGDILPDSGIYFAAVKQATISDKLAEDIAKNKGQYAISLITLYAEGAEDK